jgi:integrase
MARKGGHDRGLFERPKGSGVWWLHYHDANGRKRREKVGPKGLARKRYMQRKTEIAEGRYFPNAQRRAALLDDLANDYRVAKRREGKAVMQGEFAWRRLQTAFGGRIAETITVREIEEWRVAMLKTLSVASVNRHLTLLRAILNRAVRDGRLDASKKPAIKLLKENNSRMRYLSEDEEAHLNDELPEWLRPLITTAIHTGMRRGELLRLTWNDIDFVSGTIFVSMSKSGEGRPIPLSPTAHRILSMLRQGRRKRLKARVVAQSEASRYVFTAPHGGLILNLNREWYPALERAGITNFRFHDLRHTFASRLVMNGIDLYRVSTLMGHKTPAMTLRYAHLSPQHLRAAVATLDAPESKLRTAGHAKALADS